MLKGIKQDLDIILNGGIKSIEYGFQKIKTHNLDGFMMGREAYQNPFILREVDNIIFKQSSIFKIYSHVNVIYHQ